MKLSLNPKDAVRNNTKSLTTDTFIPIKRQMPKTAAKGEYTKVGMDIGRGVDINKNINR